MTTLDWFSHTATAPLQARERVAQHLTGYTCTVRDHARTHLGDSTSICLSGSLARGEPAVRRCRGGYVLGSDIDLVAILDDEGTTAQVQRFTSALLQAYPDIDSTVFIVRRQDLGRIAGRFGADLHQAAAYPLAGPAPAVAANPRIGPREGLEGLIHQLATIYCPDSPIGATLWRVKTALEALRAIACCDRHPVGDGPQRYSDLIDNPRVCTMLGRDMIAELVRAREHSTSMPISDAYAYEMVVSASAHLFRVPATHDDLITALHTPPPGMHLLDGFQRAVLAATIIIYGPPRHRGAAASALHVTFAAIDRDTVPTALDSLDTLARISPVEFDRGIDHPNRVLRLHLQGLRRDYYHHLGPHNFGARPVPNYTGPTPRTAAPGGRTAHG